MTITIRHSGDGDTRAAAAGVQSAAAATDGTEPFSEAVVLRQRPDAPVVAETHAVAYSPEGEVVGYGHRDGTGTAELAVVPGARRRGHGRALLDALAEQGALQVWSHGDQPGGRALAAAAGYRPVRELLQLRLTSTADPGPAALPPGVTLRAFRPGADDEEWVALNARAFAHHPEQGRLTVADLRARQAEDWFDPAGFLLAVDEDGRMVGFHWTKVHAAEQLGEVYVLGVDPDRHGGGLGTALTRAGLSYLWSRGLPTVLLYVEADNAPALAVYGRQGFTRYHADVMYSR